MDLPRRVRCFVIGAGFAGVGLAVALHRAGDDDYLVVDRDSDVGGTWLANSYPGAACDVPSQLYSYSFALNPEWSMSFSPQPEIWAYIKRVAEQAGVLDHFRFGVEVTSARWVDDEQTWHITTTAGDVVADVLINGAGSLSAPKLPDIAGIDTFEGEVFHTARWDHSQDLSGKRVAVIGTGASAIQVVPSIQPEVAHLDVYQRTAPWVMPRMDRAYTSAERSVFRALPASMRAYRTAIYWGRETYVPMFTRFPWMGNPVEVLCKLNIRRGIKDPVLRAKVTPTFDLGCKRILISNGWYPALAADNCELVTDPIAEITPTGVRTSDGTVREVDVLINATGFHTTDHPIAGVLHGRDGRTLAEVWAEASMQAYKGTTVAGFPNLFNIVGPNTVLGHSSMVFMIESQIAYITDALATMRAHGYAAIEVREDAQAAYNDDLQERMSQTVWSTGGCSSWYLDEHGRNTILWPRSTFSFRQQLRRFDVSAYRVEAPVPSPDPIGS